MNRTQVYSPDSPLKNSRKLIVEIFRDLIDSWELVMILSKRDIKAMYRQSLLGYAWVLAPPIVTALTWYFFHSQGVIKEQNTETIPYPVYVLLGTLMWQTFSDSIVAPLESFKAGSSVFTKLKVPVIAFVASGVFKNLFTLSIRLLVILPICFYLIKRLPASTTPLFFGILLLISLFGMAIGIWLIPSGSLYSDIGRAIGMGLPFLMYASPVVWSPDQKGETLQLLAKWNPMAYLLEAGRNFLFGAPTTSIVIPVTIILLISVILLLLGLIMLKVALPHLVERMGM